ncbi:MAG: hypothetical protein MJA84_14340, partial [Firmicutes bacterium]|nr:hypothetical protein [Bacillota bacterium]
IEMPSDTPKTDRILTLDQIRRISASKRRIDGIGRAFVFLDGTDSVDFLGRTVIAEWILGRFPKCAAAAAFRNISPERAAIVACAPSLKVAIDAHPESPAIAPVDWFDIGVAAPVKCPDPAWEEYDLSHPDLVLLPPMLHGRPCRIDGLADHPPRFAVPEEWTANATGYLATKGIGQENWFACVDSDLEIRRDGIPLELPDAAVFRLQDAGMPSVEWKAAIISRARFVLSADPLVLGLASAFRVPLCAAGIDDWERCVWNKADIVLPPEAMARDPHALNRALEILMDRTAGIKGWRRPVERQAKSGSGSVFLPLARTEDLAVDVWEKPRAIPG